MWRYLAALTVIAFLAIFVSIQDKRASQQYEQGTASPDKSTASAKANENQSQKNTYDAERDSPSWYSFFRWPSGVTVWAILLTLIAIAGQAGETAKATRAMQDSVTATKAKERARLLVQPPSTFLPDLIQIMEKDMPYYRVPIPLFHHGSTDAFNVKMFGNAFTDEKREVPFSAKEEVFNIPAFIRPQEEPIVAYLTALFPLEDQEKVESGGVSFHVCGKITYTDIYGNPQETTFWYVWGMEVYEMGGGARHEYQSWKPNGAAEYNHAT